MGKLFGTDGVRGIANIEPITAGSALRLAQAAVHVFAKEESHPVVVVGRDTRASGEMLESAIAAGLAAAGVHVLVAGVVPTPAVAFLTSYHGALFGIMITASHNPFQDNGIKFFGSNGYKLSDELERAIESEYFSSVAPPLAVGKSIGRIRSLQEATEQYSAYAASTVPKDFSLAGIKVLVDSANGAAYRTTPIVLAKLGAEVDLRFGLPDGFNINLDCGVPTPTLFLAWSWSPGQHSALPMTGMPTEFCFATKRDSLWMGMTFSPSPPSICWHEITYVETPSWQQ